MRTLDFVMPAISFQEMSKMAPFTATIESVEVHHAIFSSKSSVKLQLLSSGILPEVNLESYPASKTVIGFVSSRDGGRSYVFPQAYLDYVNRWGTNAVGK
jgi:hypothetical protein